MPNSDLPPPGSACRRGALLLQGRFRLRAPGTRPGRARNRVSRPCSGRRQRCPSRSGDGKNPKRSPLQRRAREPGRGPRLCCHANHLPLAHRLPESLPKRSPRQLVLEKSGKDARGPTWTCQRRSESYSKPPLFKHVFMHAVNTGFRFPPSLPRDEGWHLPKSPPANKQTLRFFSGRFGGAGAPRDNTCLHVKPCQAPGPSLANARGRGTANRRRLQLPRREQQQQVPPLLSRGR